MDVHAATVRKIKPQVEGDERLATLKSCGGQVTCERLESGEFSLKFEREVRRGLFQKIECRDGLSKVVRTGWQTSDLSVTFRLTADSLNTLGLESGSTQELLDSLAKRQGRKHLFNGYGEVGKDFADVLSSGKITEFVNARIKSTETRDFNFTNCAVQNSWIAGKRVSDEIVSQQIVPRGPRTIKSPLEELRGPSISELDLAESAIAIAGPGPESASVGASVPLPDPELSAVQSPPRKPGILRRVASCASVILGGAALLFSLLKSNQKEVESASIATQHDSLRTRDSVEQVLKSEIPTAAIVTHGPSSPHTVKHGAPSHRIILQDDKVALANSTLPKRPAVTSDGGVIDTTSTTLLANAAASDSSSELPQPNPEEPSGPLDVAVSANASIGSASFSAMSLTADRFQANFLESNNEGSALAIGTRLSVGSTDKVLVNLSVGGAVESKGLTEKTQLSPSYDLSAQTTRTSGNFEWINRVRSSYTPKLEGNENDIILQNSLEGSARSQGTLWIKSGKIIGTAGLEGEYRKDRFGFRGVDVRSEFYVPAIAQPAIPKDLVFRPFIGSFYSKSDEQRSHQLGIGLGVEVDGRLRNTYLDGGLSFEDDPLALALRGRNIHWRMKLSQRLSPQFGLFIAGQGGRETGFLEERMPTTMVKGWRAGFDLSR